MSKTVLTDGTTWTTVFSSSPTPAVSDECHEAVVEAVSTYGRFRKVYETLAGCTVSCHCGPGTLGILFVRKK